MSWLTLKKVGWVKQLPVSPAYIILWQFRCSVVHFECTKHGSLATIATVVQSSCLLFELSLTLWHLFARTLLENHLFGCHVKWHISLHLYLTALTEVRAGVPGVGGCKAGVGPKKGHDQGPSAPSPQASFQAEADPGGPGPSTSGSLQRHGCAQHFYVWRHEGSVHRAKGPHYGQCADGDGAWGDGVGSRDGYVSWQSSVRRESTSRKAW